MKKITVDAAIENLDIVLDFTNAFLEENGCPMKVQTQIAIAVEEIFVNIAHYAYAPGSGKVDITLNGEGSFEMTFADSGVAYDPLAKADPDITQSAENRSIGGLGIYMVKNMMDDVAYSYINGQNIFTMKKSW